MKISSIILSVAVIFSFSACDKNETIYPNLDANSMSGAYSGQVRIDYFINGEADSANALIISDTLRVLGAGATDLGKIVLDSKTFGLTMGQLELKSQQTGVLYFAVPLQNPQSLADSSFKQNDLINSIERPYYNNTKASIINLIILHKNADNNIVKRLSFSQLKKF